MDSPRPTFPQYRVLADYTALTTREVNLHEGEVVELVKIGCAGWWYVRLTGQLQEKMQNKKCIKGSLN